MEKLIKNIHWSLRIPLSITFIMHGFPKMGNNVLNGDLWLFGYLVGPFELFGALLIIIGPFTKPILTKIGSLFLSIIMIGAIYLHLFKWGDTFADVEWQILLLGVSIYFLIKGNDE